MVKKLPSLTRLAAATLGVASGLVSASHAYEALKIEAPMGTVALLVFVALLKIAASAQFAAAPGKKGDGVFLFLFGIASVGDVGRFLMVPFELLLITPAAFLVGGMTLWVERGRRGDSGVRPVAE
jgi:hypothetical protein